ncbi:MAG: flavodoxin domain-containing protein [Halanaeroarchaeum sp.]
MASFLLVYGTGEGQTAKIADRIAAGLRDRGHDATPVDVESGPEETAVAGADAVVVGTSIHVGKHHPAVVAFVEQFGDVLADKPTAFVQVSLSSASPDEERRAEAARYVEEFLERTGWHPDRIATFGGALRYSEYGFLERLMMKRIAKDASGDTDTSRDYEYTDWDEVAAFTADFAAFVEGRLGLAPPTGDDA